MGSLQKSIDASRWRSDKRAIDVSVNRLSPLEICEEFYRRARAKCGGKDCTCGYAAAYEEWLDKQGVRECVIGGVKYRYCNKVLDMLQRGRCRGAGM